MRKHKPKKRNRLKQKLKAEKEKEKFQKNTLIQKLLGLIFHHFPQSNLLQFNKIVINNLKHKGLGPEKVSIK